MENNRSSHRRRDALRDLVERTGITRREAGRVLNGNRLEAQYEARDHVWLGAPELPRLIEELVNKRAVDVDTYTPVELVEGHIEQQLLTNFRVQHTAIEDAYVEDSDHPDTIGVDLIVEGTGNVDWHVTMPTAGDVYAHGTEMEGVDDGPGLWQATEELAPMRVRVSARYTITTSHWTLDEVRSVDMDEAEAKDRGRDHDVEDTRRQQALGLLPTDDELEEMADRAERGHVEDLMNEVQSLLEGIDDDVLRGEFLPSSLVWSLASVRETRPERPSVTRTVIKAEITLGASDSAAADVDTLKAWVEQDSAETQVALASWAPRPSRDGDNQQVVEGTFIYSPTYDASAFRRRR
jgi:hypothetical protein